jgi:SAM-dependent methyltransferase
MNQHRKDVLATDLGEATPSSRKMEVLLKSFYYSLQRPLAHWYLSKKLKKVASSDPFLGVVDRFLWNEGGMFKDYAYSMSDTERHIKDSLVLVQGCGFGHCIFQLAKYRPKKVVAFDLYDFPEEWKYVAEKCRSVFGVEVEFIKGDFDAVPENLKGSFDHIMSDAVLEHVRNMEEFSRLSYEFLKPGGVFYASFGPLWYGPWGDHMDWGSNNRYDHILLDPKIYAEMAQKFLKDNEAVAESYEPYFLIKDDIFSRLTSSQYLAFLKGAGLKQIKLWTKISPFSLSFLEENKNVQQALDDKGYPRFDRYCLGIYLWMKK